MFLIVIAHCLAIHSDQALLGIDRIVGLDFPFFQGGHHGYGFEGGTRLTEVAYGVVLYFLVRSRGSKA
ncbi:MAG: hypothetical protein BWX77_00514 [Bacteroidetes bacterium ADurb.Bin090]|nr:MAG: hypothetical protein BWX77_00514 [Bacteroidetes bacterium ADurb.Bin090]